MYGYFDLLGDVGGLLDIFIIILAIFFDRYNSSTFLFNTIYKLYEVQKPIQGFAKFFCLHNFSCFRKSENSEIIKKCEETLEKELNVDNLLFKLR